jgi:hypothetical protein
MRLTNQSAGVNRSNFAAPVYGNWGKGGWGIFMSQLCRQPSSPLWIPPEFDCIPNCLCVTQEGCPCCLTITGFPRRARFPGFDLVTRS